MLKFLGDKNSYVGATLIFASFLLSTLLLSLVNVSNVSAYTASLSTSGTVTTNVTPNTEGDKSISINQDSVNVVTNCRAGYNLTISSSVTDRNLYKDGNSANNTSGQYFTPVNGTAQLNNTTNQYGYSLTANTESGVFTPLPLPSAPTFIKTPSQTASQTDINDDIPVYYGVSAANTLNPGLYKLANSGTILYQLTLDESCMTFTVNFNANGGTGTMTNQDITVSTPTNLSANSFTAPAYGQSYQNAAGTTIPATAYTYWSFNGWNTRADGTGTAYTDEEQVTDLANSGETITLYAQWKGTETMRVNFNGNSLEFNDGTTTNTMFYHNDCGTKYVSAPEYSHTSNINDDGTQIGTTKYDNNLATKDVVAVQGADSLHVTITYGTEASYDYLYVFQGEYTGSVTKNMSAGQLATYVGGGNTTTTVALDIPGDTATFAFYSDGSGQYWGYHAKVEGYYNTQPASYDHTTEACVKTLAGGEYKVPVDTPHKKFTGWSEDSTATTPTYTSEDDIRQNLSGNNGETKTLYAVYDNYYVITFVNTDTGATSTKQVKYGASGTITSPTVWTKTNYSLAGWDTNSAGTNVVYTKGQSVTPTSDMTVYTVWKPAYTIQYDGNGADAGVMTNVKHTNVYENDVFDLFASNYSKTNYGFAGWSFDSSAQPGGSSTIYGPNEAITAPAPSNPGQAETKTLYAVWVPAETGVYMQTWNGCDDLASNAVIALKDQRDSNVYTVGKLADGNCWMMENLRLDNTNSDNSTGSLAQGYGTGFVGLADSETSNFTNNGIANTLYSTTNITGSNQGYRFPRYNNTNTSARVASPSANDNRSSAISAHGSALNTAIYSYGNYYTWAAAKANIEDLTTKDASEAANTSLCPSGWKLPYGSNSGNGNTSGGFYYLGTQLGATTSNEASSRIWRSYPNNNVYAGYYNSTAVSSRGSNMRVWSASASSGAQGYYLSIGATSLSSTTSYKYYGSSARCLSIDKSNLSLKVSFDSTYVSSVKVCKTSGNCSGTNLMGTVTTSGDSVSGLIHDTAYYLYPIYATGSTFDSWAKDSGAVGTLSSTSAANPTYTVETGINAVTLNGKYASYTVTLDKCSATNTPSSSTTATYYSKTLATITLPIQSYTASGFTAPANNNASGAIVSSTSSITTTNTFDGWYTGSCASPTTRVATIATDPILVSNVSGYTDSSGRWTRTTTPTTLYAKFIARSITLPTITKTGGFTCGWTTSSSGATDYMYVSGATITPSNDMTLYGVCKCAANKICYSANATSGVEGAMGAQNISSSATEVKLNPSNYSRTGYGFAGWNTNAAGTGTNYGPQADITFTAGQYSATGLTLYAKWIASAGNLQGWNGCSSLASGAVTALTDTRDNQVYAVAKLADGKCWMIENLRLDSQYTTGSTNRSRAQGYGGVFTGLANAESPWAFGITTANSLYSIDGSTTNTISGSNQSFRFPRYNNTNTSVRATNPTSGSYNIYSYGNYYTWAAAIANTTDYTTNNQSVTTTSLCPSGWRLPLGGDKTEIEANRNDFWNLIVNGLNGGTKPTNYDNTPYPEYSGTAATALSKIIRSYPNNFLFSGLSHDGKFASLGTSGDYWASTTLNNQVAYYMSIYTSQVLPGTTWFYKYEGKSIRCMQ